ncbi:MAG: N-acetylmuramoyl-L-alanine amidase [Erysipelotrichaceae bacterium]|nr:N-acetylmuramoyl-L-alanine amidase [Erysipelotrichaceae bacterium]
MKKYRNIIIIGIVIVLIAALAGYMYYDEKQKQAIYDSINITLNDVLIEEGIEYGSDTTTDDLIVEVEGEIESQSELDTSIIGVQTLEFVVTKQNQSKTLTYDVEIKDTIIPVITLIKENVTLEYGDDFDASDYIESIQDPVDGDLAYSEEEIEGGYYTYESDVNTKKAGDYTVTYNAYDQSNNKATATLKVTVNEEVIEEEEETTASTSTTKTYTASNNKVIVINPGHQASGDSSTEAIGPGSSTTKAKVTTGAYCSASGKSESQINLEVGLKLKAELESRGYTVYMTRTSQNVNISNKERAQIANSYNAAAVISIHCDSTTSSSTTGAHTICITSSNPYCSQLYSTSAKLAKNVINAYCSATGIKNRGVSYRDDLTGLNWSEVPAIYIEMGFLSNSSEGSNLSDSSFQYKCATGIANGIDNYFS